MMFSKRCAILVGLAFLSAAPLAWARDAVVYTKDGKKLAGEVVKDDNSSVTLRISNIETPIPRATIERVEYKETVEEEYKRRRAQIADNNLEDRFRLARWLYDEKSYEIAKKELDDLNKRFPGEDRLRVLSRVVDEDLKLAREQATSKTPTATTKPAKSPTDKTPAGTPATALDAAGLPTERLTEKQINLIKVYEIDLKTQPAVKVPREAIDTLFKKYADDPKTPKGRDQATFRGKKGYEQLQTLFDLQARDLYGEVTVVDDPQQIIHFKRNIFRSYVLNYCATNSCHGGTKAGEFFLFRDETDRTVYTDFYILYQFQNKNGYMLDFDRPESSLLIQYGLIADTAAYPHPQVPGYKPKFLTVNDPVLVSMKEWVASFTLGRQSYGISYAIPHLKSAATTQPATAPAPTPKAVPVTPKATPQPK